MITIRDCIALSGLTDAEIDAIAEHEHLPFITALEKGADFLCHDWGSPAVRQIIHDDWRIAQSCGRHRHADDLRALFKTTCRQHPGGHDRRTRRRPAHTGSGF